ncbi:MAG: TetR/AcrR family transcriptional regulator [Propioniciclava sp.]
MGTESIAEPRRSYAKGDRRKREIVTVAMGLFAADGYTSTSMVQVATACGVSRAGLLHHFPSKENLLTAVLSARDRIDGDTFFAGADPHEDGLDFLDRLVEVVIHNTSQREIVALFTMLSAEASDPAHPAHDYFVDRYRRLRRDIAAALTDLERRGLLRSGVDPDSASADIVALMDGLQVQWLIDHDSVDIPEHLRAHLDGLTRTPT